jgi:hypothetical protein
VTCFELVFKHSREQLKAIDPEIYQFLSDLNHKPEGMFHPTWQEAVSSVQRQQRASGALTDDLLNRHDAKLVFSDEVVSGK